MGTVMAPVTSTPNPHSPRRRRPAAAHRHIGTSRQMFAATRAARADASVRMARLMRSVARLHPTSSASRSAPGWRRPAPSQRCGGRPPPPPLGAAHASNRDGSAPPGRPRAGDAGPRPARLSPKRRQSRCRHPAGERQRAERLNTAVVPLAVTFNVNGDAQEDAPKSTSTVRVVVVIRP